MRQLLKPSLNTSQNHATQTHTHIASSMVTDPTHSHTQNIYNDDYNSSATADQVPLGMTKDAYQTSDNLHVTSNVNSSATGVTVATTISNSTTTVDVNETRPYNYGVYWIIKI